MNRSGNIVVNSYRHALRLFIICLLVLFAGCATQKPDLGRLYEQQAEGARYHPVIVIHGFLGSRLRYKNNGQRTIWPPDIRELVSRETHSLALPINKKTLEPLPSEIEPYEIFDHLAKIDFYRSLTTTLQKLGRFQASQPGQAASALDRRYYILVYDWREDIVQSVRRLDRLIKQIRRDYNDPALKVDIVAHSMGGLITRYYARYGTQDVLNRNDFFPIDFGASRIHQAIFMGIPNLGSSSAVYTYIKGLGFGAYGLPTEVLTTMPSIYQLFLHPGIPWLVDIYGQSISADLYDVAMWKKNHWGPYDPVVIKRVMNQAENEWAGEKRLELLRNYFAKHLKRGKNFARSLSVRPAKHSVEYIVFGGDCELTPANILLERINGKFRLRDHPNKIINPRDDVDYYRVMLQPGDGRVTKPSLLARKTLDPAQSGRPEYFFPLHHAIMFCETHGDLTGNIHFQDNLLDTLLAGH
jgi:pimeloyl-ACP methyl ester carboxylesterase